MNGRMNGRMRIAAANVIGVPPSLTGARLETQKELAANRGWIWANLNICTCSDGGHYRDRGARGPWRNQ